MRLGLGLALAALLAGCAGSKPVARAAGAPERLELSALPSPPAALLSGTIVSVTARPVPEGQLAWVSGTVKLFGAPVLPMRPDAEGKTWHFRTMVPPLVTVPAGRYEVKAWGRTLDGAPVEGALSYEVK